MDDQIYNFNQTLFIKYFKLLCPLYTSFGLCSEVQIYKKKFANGPFLNFGDSCTIDLKEKIFSSTLYIYILKNYYS